MALLEFKSVEMVKRSMAGVSQDVAVFRYELSGEGVDRGAIEIDVAMTTPDLGAAQAEAEKRIADFAAEFANLTAARRTP